MKEYPDIHARLIELGFFVDRRSITPNLHNHTIWYRLPSKTWLLVWDIDKSGEHWKAHYITAHMDCICYLTAANAIDKSDRHQAIPVANWRLELAESIRIFEPDTNQVALI